MDLSGIATTTDFEALIDDPEVELIDICLRTDLHRAVAERALASGKHVLLEKPMALDSVEGLAIKTAADGGGGFFMVAHCIRFWPQYCYLREIVQQELYGKVREAFFRRMSGPPIYGEQNWFMSPAVSGGALLDFHIHDVDFALDLMGIPESVRAWGDNCLTGGIDAIHAAFQYPNGAQATLIGGWAYHGKFPFNMEFIVRCEKATIDFNFRSGNP